MIEISEGLWSKLNKERSIKNKFTLDEFKKAIEDLFYKKSIEKPITNIPIVLINSLSNEDFINIHKGRLDYTFYGSLKQVNVYHKRKKELNI